MIAALLIVAALNCGATATQFDLDSCAAQAQTRADAREKAAFAAAERRFPNDAGLSRSEVMWRDARSSACGYVSATVAGGSIQPMLEAQCDADAAQARVRDIGMFTGRANPAAMMPSSQSAAEHNRIYGLLELLVSPDERKLLAASENVFLRYRAAACTRAKDGCATALTLTRTQQLKDSWLADPFW